MGKDVDIEPQEIRLVWSNGETSDQTAVIDELETNGNLIRCRLTTNFIPAHLVANRIQMLRMEGNLDGRRVEPLAHKFTASGPMSSSALTLTAWFRVLEYEQQSFSWALATGHSFGIVFYALGVASVVFSLAPNVEGEPEAYGAIIWSCLFWGFPVSFLFQKKMFIGGCLLLNIVVVWLIRMSL